MKTSLLIQSIAVAAFVLQPGQRVKIYYRREIGQLVPREVSLRTQNANALHDWSVLRQTELVDHVC